MFKQIKISTLLFGINLLLPALTYAVSDNNTDVIQAEISLHQHGCTSGLCPQRNPGGFDQSAHTSDFLDTTNPFFQELGTNGRSCNTCHLVDQGWSITTKKIRQLYNETDAQAPLFRAIDAANAPTADISTPEARLTAFSQILSRGVIRIGRPVPPTAEFELDTVDDPTGFSTPTGLSLFRRPLPIANLRFSFNNQLGWPKQSSRRYKQHTPWFDEPIKRCHN